MGLLAFSSIVSSVNELGYTELKMCFMVYDLKEAALYNEEEYGKKNPLRNRHFVDNE